MSMSAAPSTRLSDFFADAVDILPVTQIGENTVTFATGLSGFTWTIWFGGGGGVWMHAPTQGTSRNSVTCLPETARSFQTSRGDTATLSRHLAFLDIVEPASASLYRTLSLRLVDLADLPDDVKARLRVTLGG